MQFYYTLRGPTTASPQPPLKPRMDYMRTRLRLCSDINGYRIDHNYYI